ncbi:MAG: ATP-binding protein [Pseudomonadota bacterium]
MIQYHWEPQQLQKAKRVYESHTHELLHASETGIVHDLLERDLASLFSNIEYLEQSHKDRWFNITLYRDDGKRIYPLFEREAEAMLSGRELVHITHPLEIEGTSLGQLEMDIDWGAEKRDAMESINGVRNMVLLLIALALLVSVVSQYRFIYRPLNHLRKLTDKAASGEFDAELPEAAADEIGDLTKSFKAMMVALQFQKHALDQHAIVSVADHKGLITYVNQQFLDTSGFTREELLGSNHRIIKSDVHSPEFFKEMWSTIARGDIWHGEICNQNRDGKKYWVNSTIVPFVGEDNKPEHYISIRTDITERKLVESAMVEARHEAEEANRAKSQFLSSMSHELRTPMNAIIGFSQLLEMDEDQPLSESQQENVGEILRAGSHLLELINEVLDLARIDVGRIDLSIEAVAFGEVVAESLQLIAPLAQVRGIEIDLFLDGVELTLEQLVRQHTAVRADRTRLKQILLNLLSNAVKYNRENGKIIVSCNHAENNRTRISITDTGAGLTQKQQTELFKAFNRLGAEQSEIEGTGIGLVITRSLVELMGGDIGVDSQPGEGSSFWFELPNDRLLPGQESAVDEKGATEQHPIKKPEHEHTVLYIEDNPANLRLVSRVLGLMSHVHMWSAHEPLLGLELAAEHNPDLILLDINLPGMDGFEVLRQLRQREATLEATVIAISANAMPRDIERGLEAGFNDYITKPIDIKALMQAVESALQGVK